jgi:hypothetical protein
MSEETIKRNNLEVETLLIFLLNYNRKKKKARVPNEEKPGWY